MVRQAERGLRPSTTAMDEPTTFVDAWTGETYQPENYYKDYNGRVTLRESLERSLNIPSVRLLNYIGYDHAIATTRKFAPEWYRRGRLLGKWRSRSFGSRAHDRKFIAVTASPRASASCSTDSPRVPRERRRPDAGEWARSGWVGERRARLGPGRGFRRTFQ